MKQILLYVGLILLGLTLSTTSALASGGGKSKSSHEKPAHGSSTKESAGDSSRPNYLEFPQMTSSVLQKYRVRGMITLGFGLEIVDEKKRVQARARLPRLQDMYTTEWNQYAGNIYQAGEVPDATYISRRMQAATDRMLGKGTAIFLISNLMVRAK